jgi:hypothetical protein
LVIESRSQDLTKQFSSSHVSYSSDFWSFGAAFVPVT